MNPERKAKELVEKFHEQCSRKANNLLEESLEKIRSRAKKCAFIVAEEQLAENHLIYDTDKLNNNGIDVLTERVIYWQAVMKEIGKA